LPRSVTISWIWYYPYLLRNLPVIRPNQVRAMDITYTDGARLRLSRHVFGSADIAEAAVEARD
jgi:hypothetical protein